MMAQNQGILAVLFSALDVNVSTGVWGERVSRGVSACSGAVGGMCPLPSSCIQEGLILTLHWICFCDFNPCFWPLLLLQHT